MSARPELKFEGHDQFQRRRIAEKIITLLKSDISVSPMVIDGTWGLGKTVFCHRLIDLMREKDTHELIYIDAFKADHANEPLLTVLAEVLKVLPDSNQQNELIKKALPTLRYGLKVGGKALVSHLLKQDIADVVDEYDKEIQQVTDKAIDASVESLLKDHVAAEKNLKALQDALAKIATIKPIVIFVDELDRCRPDFAVLMLETIKHTFDVEGVQFVLVTNTEQLKASINHCYGPTIDAQRYLDKFLKFSFSLPNTVSNYSYDCSLASVEHYKNLVVNSSLLKSTELNRDSCLELIERIIDTNSLSLREIETFVRHLEIYQTISEHSPLDNSTRIYKLLRLLGVSIFSFKPDLARSVLTNKADALELGKLIGVYQLRSLDGNYDYPSYPNILMYALAAECKFNNDQYIPDNTEQKEHWDKVADQMFRDLWPDRKGERIKIVLEAITSLGLSGSR